MAILSVDTSTFGQEVLLATLPVVVVFFEEDDLWEIFKPDLEEVSKRMHGRVKIVKVKVNENQKIADQFGIRGTPARLLFKDGALKALMYGVPTRPLLMKWILSPDTY